MISVPFTHFQDPDNYSFEVCTAAGFAGRVYHDITYYSLFAGSLGYMLYLQIRVRQLEAVGSENVKAPTFVAARTVLTYYPTILMICWFPHVITTLIIVYGTWCNVSCENLYYLGDLLKVLHGTAAASVFFLKSREARRLWYKLLFGKNPDGIITYDLSLINEEHLLADSSLSNGIHETLLTTGPRTADTTYLQF